jgi:hypothetical protein
MPGPFAIPAKSGGIQVSADGVLTAVGDSSWGKSIDVSNRGEYYPRKDGGFVMTKEDASQLRHRRQRDDNRGQRAF